MLIINCHISSPLVSQGKFIRINFDVAGYIVGANIETCILPLQSDSVSSPNLNITVVTHLYAHWWVTANLSSGRSCPTHRGQLREAGDVKLPLG